MWRKYVQMAQVAAVFLVLEGEEKRVEVQRFLIR